jgi:hypothetical protein
MKEPFIGIERRKSAAASPTKRIEPPQFFTPMYPIFMDPLTYHMVSDA